MFGFTRRIDIDPSPPFHPALRFPDGTPIPILGADDEPREEKEEPDRVPSSEMPGEDSAEAAAKPPCP